MKIPLPSKLADYLGNHQFMSLAGNIALSALSIISVSLLFRALPLRDTGIWIVFSSTVGLADAFRAGFLSTALVRACSGASPARTAEVVGSAWVIALAITGGLLLLNLFTWLGFTVLNHPFTDETRLLMHWFGVMLVATLPYFIAVCVLHANMRFDKILYIRLLSQGMFVLSVVGMMLTHTTTLERVVYAYVLSSAVTSLVTMVLGWARANNIRQRSSQCISELTHFGKYSVGSNVGANLLRSSDTYLINFLLGPAPLAVYNLASRFMEIIDIPLRSFLATAIPALSAAFNNNRMDEVARLMRKNAGMLTWAFLPVIIGTILLADIPIYLIGGHKYQGTEAANLLRISMAIAILYPIDRFVGVTLDVVNQPRINLIKVFVMLAFNVIGDVVAIKLFHNIYGVAVANLPTVLVGFVYGYTQLRKWLPFTIRGIMVTGFEETKALIMKVLGKTPVLEPSQEPH